jgi:CspA family cold shock protein
MDQLTGLIKFWNEAKGYGFITPSGGGPDVFVHFSNIVGVGRRDLFSGQRVEFEIGIGKKGSEAKRVKPLLK